MRLQLVRLFVLAYVNCAYRTRYGAVTSPSQLNVAAGEFQQKNDLSSGATVNIESWDVPQYSVSGHKTHETAWEERNAETDPADAASLEKLVEEGVLTKYQAETARKLTDEGVSIVPIVKACKSLPVDPSRGYCGQVYGAEHKVKESGPCLWMLVLAGGLLVLWPALCYLKPHVEIDPDPSESQYPAGPIQNNDSLFQTFRLAASPKEGATRAGGGADGNASECGASAKMSEFPSHWSTARPTIADPGPLLQRERTTVDWLKLCLWGFVLVVVPLMAAGLLIVGLRKEQEETDLCICRNGPLAGDDPYCQLGDDIREFDKRKYEEFRCHCQSEGGETPWSDTKVYRSEAVDLVLQMGSLVATNGMSPAEFQGQVEGCGIDASKRDDLEHLLQLSAMLSLEGKCDDSSEDFDSCYERELSQDKNVLFRKSALSRMARVLSAKTKREKIENKCKCNEFRNNPIKQGHLIDVAKKNRIPVSATMMREAALILCKEEGDLRGVPMIATFHRACTPDHWGYCCSKMSIGDNLAEYTVRKMQLVQNSVMKISEYTEEVIQTSEQLEAQVLAVTRIDKIENKPKVMLYKLFTIFFHHAQLFLRRQEFCALHPEELSACEDPTTYSHTVARVHGELMKSARAMKGLLSCLQYGTRSIEEELSDGRSYLEKFLGVVRNVIVRVIHEIGTGNLMARARGLAVALGKTVYKYRFELMLAGVVAAGAQPLMLAITSTGITTGAATSWSLVFDQLVRNIILYIGCPIIQSPLLMSMLVRWAMANIVLHDVFIDLVIMPLWKMAKVSMGPIGVAMDVVNTGVEAVGSLLRKIRERLKSQGNATNATMEVQKTWLEVAREFHQTPAADFLYMLLSVWLGWIWRTVATVACTVSKVALPVFNGVESTMDAATQGASSYWMKFAGGASNFFKRVLGNSSSAESVNMMLAANNVANANMGAVAPKVLAAAHSILSKVNLLGTTSVNAILDVTIGALSHITQNVVVGYGIAHLFCWFFKTWWNPAPKTTAVHDRTIVTAMDSAQDSFNQGTCQGKQTNAKCLYLDKAGLEKEEVLQGSCCRAVCQKNTGACNVDLAEERADAAWDPKAVSLEHLHSQSRLLLNFIGMVRSSYGRDCEMLPTEPSHLQLFQFTSNSSDAKLEHHPAASFALAA